MIIRTLSYIDKTIAGNKHYRQHFYNILLFETQVKPEIFGSLYLCTL